MGLIYTCDRCGDKITKVGNGINSPNVIFRNGGTYYLCDECMTILNAFMDGDDLLKKEKEEMILKYNHDEFFKAIVDNVVSQERLNKPEELFDKLINLSRRDRKEEE